MILIQKLQVSKECGVFVIAIMTSPAFHVTLLMKTFDENLALCTGRITLESTYLIASSIQSSLPFQKNRMSSNDMLILVYAVLV